MEKTFNPVEVEPRWQARWEELHVGRADASSPRPTFSMALPPPNITDVLHLGHTVCFSIPDTLARQRRMRGFEVEWCPGSDHAAIATQNVLERQLAAEGTGREAVGREAFLGRAEEWYRQVGTQIFTQMRALGHTCDWERARFTLDAGYVRAIRVVFKSLYDEGLVYRGPRIVNWCPRCQTAISDEEILWVEHADTLVSLRYPLADPVLGPGGEGDSGIVVATVRPETMLGDSAVAVAPDDPRYRHLVGRAVVLPLTGRSVPIVADEAVEPEFGTGALKVTPGHDATDAEIGRRHGLPVISVIDVHGRMDVPDLPRFDGLTVSEAREEVTRALREVGAVVAEREYVHDVAHCDRCKSVIEPLVSEQWWVRMEELAHPAIAAVEDGRVRFHPERPHTDVYLAWMRGLRDWCISRQLWLGHAIPVSSCVNRHRFAWVDRPERCPECGSAELTDDPDVLDTWFSSALWPFAIFGWPDRTEDLRRFYPTDVMVTGRDIIFLWVARMVMTGLRFAGEAPFTDVVINSTVLARDGSRMQKSKGNGVDPLDMIARHGADAVRAWAAAVGTAGQGMRFDESRLASYRLFANKLWNVTRLLVMRAGDGADTIHVVGEPPREELRVEDLWVLRRVSAAAAAVDAGIDQYRFHDAMEVLYTTAWDVFCSQYIELVKDRLGSDGAATWTAVTVLDVVLRLLHPFMPFVTEECAQRLGEPAPTLLRREWPRPPRWWAEGAAEAESVDALLELAAALRALRQEAGLAPRVVLDLVVGEATRLSPADVRRLLEAMPTLWVRVADAVPPGTHPLRVHAGGVEAALCVPERDADDERARLGVEREAAAASVERARARLTPEFVARAPAPVVDRARAQLDDAERRLRALERAIADG